MNALVLGDSLEVLIDHRGRTPKKLGVDFTEEGVPVVSAILVAEGRINLANARYVSRSTFERWMPIRARKGDVLLTSEAPLGRVARVQSDDPLVLGQRVYGLRGQAGVLDSGYLYYALQHASTLGDLMGRSTGTTVFGIRQSALRQVRIPAPEYSAQQAIAEVLGALDDKIGANMRLALTAEALAATEFDRLRERSSAVSTVADLIACGSLVMSDGYRTKRSELTDAGYRIVRVADVRDGIAHLDGPDFVSSDHRAAMGQKVGAPGDILLTTKGTVGRVAVLPTTEERVVYSPQVCFFRIVTEERVTRSYLRLWLTGREFSEQASHRMNNTDMAPYINLADIRSLRISHPALTDQVAAGGLFDALEDGVHACQRENRQLARLRDTLLPELMSGRFRVKDAEQAVGEVA